MKAWILATTETVVRWYVFDVTRVVDGGTVPHELIDHLDLDRCPQFADKGTAARMAKALGLRTWRYVRL